jgi:uncharacterized protein
MDPQPGVPPRITFVSLGAMDVPKLRRFYAAWGWTEGPGGTADFAQFLLHNTRFALYRRDLLHEEAAADMPDRGTEHWSGVVLAINVSSREEVDAVFAAAVHAGARAIVEPIARDWGGYSGYISDPEGHRWEIAWLSTYPLDGWPSAPEPLAS